MSASGVNATESIVQSINFDGEPPRIMILGASGGVGQWVCRLASARGWTGTAVVRHGTDCADVRGFETVRGDVTSATFLEKVVVRHDAVISCLGLRRASPMNPWSRILSPLDLTERVAKHLAVVMPAANVQRLVVISAAGVGESFAHTNAVLRWLIAKSNLGAAYKDLNMMEDVLRGSALDWSAIRPTTLYHGRPTGKARAVSRYTTLSRVSRGDVAMWMLDTLATPTDRSNRTPMIAMTPFARWRTAGR